MEHPAQELLEAGEVRDVGHREVTAGDDDVVELLGGDDVVGEVVGGDRELLRAFVERHLAHGMAESDEPADVALLDAALDVVPEDFPRRVRGDGPAEVLLEGVVAELEALLGAIRPEVAVHRTVDGLAIFVDAGAPRVVPEAAPVVLLLVADELGDLRALGGRRGEGPQLGQAAGTCADDGDSLGHVVISPGDSVGALGRYPYRGADGNVPEGVITPASIRVVTCRSRGTLWRPCEAGRATRSVRRRCRVAGRRRLPRRPSVP